MIRKKQQNRRDTRDRYINYQVEQFKGLIEFIEQVTRRRMDWDKLAEYVDISLETWRVWDEAEKLRKAIPCPMGTEDNFNVFVPGVMREGTQAALDFYKELHAELQYRVENKIGVIPDEKYRLIWGGGLPPWHTMNIFNYFEKLGAVFVREVGTPMGGDPVPDSVTDPLARLAYRDYMAYRERHRHDLTGLGYNFLTFGNPVDLIEAYHADGVVLHQLKSCRSTTVGQLYCTQLVKKYCGVPTLILESDICDVRDYFEADWKAKIDAFLETVAIHKQGKQR